MKKVMFLMAVAGMFAFAACNTTPAEEETVDTTPATEEMTEEATEEVADSTVEMPAEETETPAAE